MRFLGFVFVAVIFSFLILIGDYYLQGDYLANFLNYHFIETFAALAGFNIAAVIFLVGQLITLEQKYQKEFTRTRKEIKQNAYFLLGSFVLCLVALIFRPDSNGGIVGNEIHFLFNLGIISLFGLAVYSIFEILAAVFNLSKNSS